MGQTTHSSLNLLCAQAAISLENAQLYEREQEKSQSLQASLEQLQKTEASLAKEREFLKAIVHNITDGIVVCDGSGTLTLFNKATSEFHGLPMESLPPEQWAQYFSLYQKDQETFPHKSEEIQDHESEIDLEYSLEDLPKMLDSMTMACDRLKNISTSLRNFSRSDKDYKVLFNIHQGIDTTILILKHRLKANEQRPAIEVVTNYGNLPQIDCFPGQLNQVFMNIMANAIDALEESNNGRSFEEIKAQINRIIVTTSGENNFVKIAIADNGKGMTESVKQKIFDHLFTTKAVGKGTGLGLASQNKSSNQPTSAN